MTRRAIVVSALWMVFLASGSVSALAQESGTIRGRVTVEGDGDPIGGAAVRLVELDLETTTDAEGRFTFRDVRTGTYTLEVEALGRSAARRSVAVGDEAIVVALPVRAIQAPPIAVLLERFRVVGDPTDLAAIPGSAHLIGPQDLEKQKLLYDDVNKILRQVPGINIQEEDGYGLRPNVGIRGTGSERSSKITLMEDGVLIAPAPYAAPAAYYFPVAGRMEAIEVRKGSSQIKYGPHTIGGALNLVSSSVPEDLSWLADIEGGEDASGKLRARAGDSYRHFGWVAETYQILTDGFKRLDGGGETGFEIADYLLKLRVNTDADAAVPQALELKLQYYDETSDETYLGLTEQDFRTSPLRRYAASQADVMRAEHSQIQLSHRVQLAPALDISTVLYRNDFDRNWYKLGSVGGEGIADILDDPTVFPELMTVILGATSEPGALEVTAGIREYYSQGIQSIVGLDIGTTVRNEIEIGLRYHEDEEDRFQHEDLFQMVDGSMELTEAGAPGSQSNRVSNARAWALFAQDQVRYGRWTIVPGLRYETIDFTRTDYATDDPGRMAPTGVRGSGIDALIPGLGVSFEAGVGLHLFGGVHKGFGPPGPSADDETEPEKSLNYELGARLQRRSLSAQAVAFFNDYRNTLGRQTLATGDPTGAGELFNGGEVEVSGLELSLDYDLAEPIPLGVGLPVRLAYTYTSSEFGTSFESEFGPWGSVEAGDELPYLPAHQLYLGVGMEAGPWALRLAANHVDEMRTEAGSGPIPAGRGTDAFTVWNASGEYRIMAGSTLFVGIQNLTDEVYVAARRPAGARPGLPRTLLAGIRVSR
ncbi:MAG: TonB-dependent receptor domain-containing protein [Gemmatimonadota bacterium]